MEEPLWKITAYISWALISAQQPSRLHFLTPMTISSFPIMSVIFANIQETLESLIRKAYDKTGDLSVCPMITGSGGLTLAKHLEVPFVQEVIAVSTALTHYAPQTDVAIELGGEDAKIIYFEAVTWNSV